MITVMFDDCEVFLLLSPYSKLICSISDRMESIPVSQAVGRILSDLIEVEAGRFDCDHFRIHPHRKDWTPLEMWITGEDRILCRMDWAVLDSSYRLLELRSSA